MSKENNLHDFLTDIADAVREKKGTTEPINAQNLSSEIRNIESGGGGGTEVSDAIVTRTITSYSNDIITEIGEFTFRGCSALTMVELPNVTKIGQQCFYGTSIVELNLPELAIVGLNAIASSKVARFIAPANDLNAQSLRDANNLRFVRLTNKNKVFIGNMSFYNDTSLDTLIIESESVASNLGSSTLGFTKIANGTGYIYVPDNLVGDYKAATNWSVFADQIRPLSEYVYLDFTDPVVEKLCAENFGDGTGTTQVQANAVTTFPNIFKGNTEITSFDEFEKFQNVTSIGLYAFNFCSALKSIKIPDSLEYLSQTMFANCINLKTVNISNNSRLSDIRFLAFDACRELTSINIPSGVTTMGFSVFRNCSNLTTVTCRNSNVPTVGTNIFQDVPISTLNIYVPDESVTAYKSATNWSMYADQIKPLSEYQPNNE